MQQLQAVWSQPPTLPPWLIFVCSFRLPARAVFHLAKPRPSPPVHTPIPTSSAHHRNRSSHLLPIIPYSRKKMGHSTPHRYLFVDLIDAFLVQLSHYARVLWFPPFLSSLQPCYRPWFPICCLGQHRHPPCPVLYSLPPSSSPLGIQSNPSLSLSRSNTFAFLEMALDFIKTYHVICHRYARVTQEKKESVQSDSSRKYWGGDLLCNATVA